MTKLRTRLIGEAALHTAVRVASGLLSLYLFALLGRLYPTGQVKDLYFFLMIFGFAASALRTLANVSAGLHPGQSRALKLRRIKSAIGEVLLASVLVVPIAAWLLGQHVPHPALLAGASIILVGAALDSDPLRALVDRPARFSAAFALGSLMAVTWMLSMTTASVEHAVFAMLLQWVPVAVVNYLSLYRIGLDSIAAGLRRITDESASVATLFVVAIFDGLMLNLPFLLGASAPSSVGIDAAIAVRVFSASLIMFPLILHWSNARTLAQVAKAMNTTSARAYFLMQCASAISCGLVFGIAYSWVSHQQFGAGQVGMFVALVIAFCVYTAAARFGSRGASSRGLALVLAAIVIGSMSSGLYLVTHQSVQAWFIAALQCAGLMLGGIAIYVFGRVAGNGVSATNR